MKRFASVVIVLCVSLTAFCQEFVTVAGRVFDSSTNDPMRFVSVGLEGTTLGNITNSEGVFSLKIPREKVKDGVVFLSQLGYLEVRVPVMDFEGYNVDNPLKITMNMVSIKLDPSVVYASDAEAIVRKAYDKVRDNYSREHQTMTAFYRELIKKGNIKYLSLNEAVLDIDKAPYNGYKADKAGIYKGRGTINYDSSDTLLVKYQGGVFTSLDIDLVKNPFPGVLATEMFTYYDFTIGESVVLDNRLFYCIEFDQKPHIKEALFRGKLYIDSETFAISRAEFNVNVEDYPEVVNHFVVKHSNKTQFTVESVGYVVNFKEYEGLWYYDYSHVELQFTARHKYSPFRQHFSIVSEMAVTNHHPGEIEIENESKMRLRDQLSERVQDFVDENFWEGYNVIEPDTNIDAIVRRIVRQLNRRNSSR